MAEATLHRELAAELPDQPRWVEVRGLLLRGRCEVLLGPEGRRGGGYFVVERGRPRAWAVGRPVGALVADLLALPEPPTEVLASVEQVEHLTSLLPDWDVAHVALHVHPEPDRLLAARYPENRHPTRFLDPSEGEAFEGLPDDVRAALEHALAHAPVAAAFDGPRAVSFCTALYETERWWDVKMHTRAGWRRRGFGSAAAARLLRRMAEAGKVPVWGAQLANAASLGLAEKYGLKAVARVACFTHEGRSRPALPGSAGPDGVPQ